jgi:hypothetical protein
MPVERGDIGRNTALTGAPNVLLIIADDLARDVTRITGAGAAKQMQVVTNDGTTEIVGDLPNLSLLLRKGLYFSRPGPSLSAHRPAPPSTQERTPGGTASVPRVVTRSFPPPP